MIQDTHRDSVKQTKFRPLTTLLVYYTMLLGVGYDGADKLMSFLSYLEIESSASVQNYLIKKDKCMNSSRIRKIRNKKIRRELRVDTDRKRPISQL